MPLDAAFDQFPTLDTDRLILRDVRMTDLEALFSIMSDRRVMAYYGRPPHQTIEDTRAWLEQLLGRIERREALRWAITLRGNDTLIGTVSLHNFGPGRVEIGYELNPAYWGQGIMTEAVTAVLNYVFSQTDVHRVEAIIDIHSTESKALLEKLGFTYEGNLRQRYPSDRGFVDEHYYGLLRDEWRGATTP